MFKIKEIKLLRGDVACYVAQARAPIDAEIGQKDHPWMETNYIRSSSSFCFPKRPEGLTINTANIAINGTNMAQ